MTIQDAVFGELEYGRYGWKTKLHVPMFDAVLPLEISAAKNVLPGAKDYEVWQGFMRDQPGLKAVVEKILDDYYHRHLEDLRMPYGPEEEEEFAPTLKEAKQIWSLLKPLSLNIELGHDDAACALSVEFWAKWDEEHGLDIVFYQNQIGVSDAGAHWLNHDRYDLQGKLLYLDGEE